MNEIVRVFQRNVIEIVTFLQVLKLRLSAIEFIRRLILPFATNSLFQDTS